MIQDLKSMAFANVPALQFKTCDVLGSNSKCLNFLPLQNRNLFVKTLVVEAKANTRTESAKIRNRRMRKKFNGNPRRPRLSVFCSDKQLYAMLVDDKNKKCLFYGSTLQKSIRDDPPCTIIEAAKRVGEKLVKACVDLNINEISYYDRNGFARGERMQAFEIAIAQHGFLPR
ncbi:PREDICTED: 50S ribosomal protein L18 [Theobroma cacao]|uniref:50S ribosomal protein L18 n=1 Tax=Theobroma cacao TaxID=3641 RepID=A0AB32VXK2_THECC|nr:PREDICTED: 50S ribosomal protein L18 [Theobroma cacao]XP_017970969.1 PREDICTED: 50S ribosomal protein L18 [Theobroma cacao]XP_017970970.1 PREDICTED: 50S ribosomal protein L18 [Theobroma cacao]XP_017970971.1 PREDICTED: 50S ribosomal protein L18 [Theobroma cacao]